MLNVERQRGLSHVAPDICVDHPENCPIRMRAQNLLYSRGSHSGRPNKDDIFRKNRSCYIIHVVFDTKMAASFFNRLAAFGAGVAALGGVVNTALYNGKET